MEDAAYDTPIIRFGSVGMIVMAKVDTAAYFRGRERHARRLAGIALSPAIEAIHLSMADNYAAMADDAERLESPPQRVRVVS